MSLNVSSRRFAGRIAAVCALGALAAAPAASADVPSVASLLPTQAQIAQTAVKNHESVASVAAKARALAPIIKDFAPKAQPRVQTGGLSYREVTRAPVDECFSTIGGPKATPDAQGNCPAGFTPKRNQSYPQG